MLYVVGRTRSRPTLWSFYHLENLYLVHLKEFRSCRYMGTPAANSGTSFRSTNNTCQRRFPNPKTLTCIRGRGAPARPTKEDTLRHTWERPTPYTDPLTPSRDFHASGKCVTHNSPTPFRIFLNLDPRPSSRYTKQNILQLHGL